MVDEIDRLVEYVFNIREKSEYEFRTLYGLTFVFKISTIIMNENMTSAEIKPLAIIYEENREYYLAPLDVIEDIGGTSTTSGPVRFFCKINSKSSRLSTLTPSIP